MANGQFEIQETAVFLDQLTHCSTCIDVGANIGLYSCLAANLGKHVIAVEPLDSNLALLYRNLGSNDFVDVEIFPVALADCPGIRMLYGEGTGASLIPGWANTSTRWAKSIPISTLDIIVGQRFEGERILIKVDVEGLEEEVLRGASYVLARTPRPVWLVEICLDEHFPNGLNQRFSGTFELFWKHGYRAATADTEGRTVSPNDVQRWSRQRHVDFGSHNYLFSAV
jgi:FkbM family methyltransferase